jgi:Tol biopolymer transport system component
VLLPGSRNFGSVSSCADRYLVFDDDSGGSLKLFRTDPDGANPLKFAEQAALPECSPDGTWVLYSSTTKYFRQPISGGAPVEIPNIPSIANFAHISPDGQWIAYRYQEGTPIPIPKFAVVPVSGGPPTHIFTFPTNSGGLIWSPDSKSLQFAVTANGVGNLWEQPLSGGPPHPVTKFTSSRLFGFSWSRDGKQLLLARGEATSDVILISNFH